MPSNTVLQRFCDSLAAKDAAGVAWLFNSQGLFEFPFAGQRHSFPIETVLEFPRCRST